MAIRWQLPGPCLRPPRHQSTEVMEALVRSLVALFLLGSFAGCGGGEGLSVENPFGPLSPRDTPDRGPYGTTLRVLRTLPHDGWSEGLDVRGGILWHAYPHSIEELDAATGEILRVHEPPSDYSESVAWRGDTLWNLSYSDANVYAGTIGADGAIDWRIAGRGPDVHGWGIAHDGRDLIVTGNGQPTIWFLDPGTLAVTRTIATPIDDLEDLAWDGKWIWASSYSLYPGTIFRVDPRTGAVVDFYSLPDPDACPIVDGIAVDGDVLYVTGKNCPFIWIAELPW